MVSELGFWYVKKMDLTISSLLDVVDRLGWSGGRTDLLTYPEYVLFKGIDTIIDEKRIRLGLKLNVYALPFNPTALIQKIPNIDKEEDNNEDKPATKQITSIKNNTNTPKQTHDKWVKVTVTKNRHKAVHEAEIQKEKKRHGKKGVMKKKENRYQELKDKEDEEGNNLNEDLRMETKKKDVSDLKDKKVLQETTPSI